MGVSGRQLRALERQLVAMTSTFPQPTPPEAAGAALASIFAARSNALYRGFLHAMSGPSRPTALIALRSLVELAMLMKWYSLDPELHGELWAAQSDASLLRMLAELREHLGEVHDIPDPGPEGERRNEDRQRAVAKAREILEARGRNYGNRIAPGLDRMIREIVERDPGYRIVARQAYIAAYRNLSPWDHSEAFSFQLTVETLSETELRWIGERIPWSGETLRATGGAMAAFCVEVALEMARDDTGRMAARRIRDELTDSEAYAARRAAREAADNPRQR